MSIVEKKEIQFESLTPILNVSDMARSLAYYRNVLGFTIDWEWGDPTGFASVSRGAVCLFLCEGAQGSGVNWISVFIDDVDALYKEYQASGAIIRQEPQNFPWHMREMNVSDPDGHCLRMGCSSTDASDGVPLAE